MPSIAGVQSIDDLGKGIAYGNSSFSSPKTPPFVADWEIVDNQLEGLWDDGTESTTPDEPTNPIPTDPDEPVKKKTVDEQIKEDVLKRNRLEGSYEDNVDALAQRMKYNPAATDLDYKEAFGKCDAFGCYWPDETDSGDYYSVGKGGGTAHAKRGQAASRAKAAATRNMSAREGKRKATRSQSKSGS